MAERDKNAPGCTSVPTCAFAQLAQHFSESAERIAHKICDAMLSGNVPVAASLYQRGLYAERQHRWYSALARLAAPDAGDQPLLESGD